MPTVNRGSAWLKDKATIQRPIATRNVNSELVIAPGSQSEVFACRVTQPRGRAAQSDEVRAGVVQYNLRTYYDVHKGDKITATRRHSTDSVLVLNADAVEIGDSGIRIVRCYLVQE